MRMVSPAELDGYPGPLHVLELADGLSLSPAQRRQTQAWFERMRAAPLQAHLEQVRMLSAAQVLQYNRMRGDGG